MAKDRLSGKFAVILHADVAGSTLLVQQDEQLAHERIQDAFRRFSESIEKYMGRVLELRGDALLADFERPSDAVTATLAFQADHTHQNSRIKDDLRPTIRVGIAMGEVVIADATVTGAGVVLAQRVEQLANPGGLCITAALHEALPKRMPFDLENLGEQVLKGFDDPVRVYRVGLSPGKSIPPPQHKSQHETSKKRWGLMAAIAVVVMVIAVGTAYWFKSTVPQEEPAAPERMAFPLPDKPSIAVLPFANLSSDLEQEYFSDGITLDIITNLSRFPDLFVIARNSTFTYKGQSVTVNQVSEELGVRYVLQGSVQKTGNKVRITAQLVDATTGYHLWAENYDRDLDDIFAVRDEVTQSIVATLMGAENGKLQQAELDRLLRKDTENLDAYEYILRSIHIWLRFTRDANTEAGRLAEKAIELDPEYARASMMLAWVHLNEYRWKWSDNPESSLERAYEIARKSIELDDSDPWSHWALGVVYLYRGDHEEAIAQYEKALARNPNDADVLAHMGLPLSFAGRPEQAVEQLNHAMRLNPAHPPWYPWIQGFAQVVAEQYEASIAPSKEAAGRFPKIAEIHRNLAVAYHYLGRAAEARAEVEESLRIDPKFTLDDLEAALPFANQADLKRFLLALREAGLPEHPTLPLPDKPSIAVLPFTNMSGDAEQEYFVDGMTEDLITDLSKLAGLFVIARNSSFTYKGKSVKVGQVAEELGVRYVLEGSVRRAGNQVRINAQLIDATSGGHLWAERYDGSLQDIFALQDQVTRQIVAALKVSLTGEEEAQRETHETDSVEAHDAFLQGWAHYKLGTPGDLARGIPYLEEAIRLDPDYSRAHAALSSIYWNAYVSDWAFDLGMPSFTAEKLANEHLKQALKTPNPLAHAQQAQVYLSLGFPEEAVHEAQQAVDLDGNDATAHATLANALVLIDRPQEGADVIRRAMRLDPHHPPGYLTILGAAIFGQEQFENAVKILERAVNRNPEDEAPLIYLASSYGHLGRMREAEDTIETANDLRTRFGLGALALERTDAWTAYRFDGSYNPRSGMINFSSFGTEPAQERLRAGLSDIPALTWHRLIKMQSVLASGSITWIEIEGATKIDLTTAKAFYDRGVLFIDAGSKANWKKGHVPGAVSLPWVAPDPIKVRLRETTLDEITDRTAEIVFYWCSPGNVCTPSWAVAKTVNWGYGQVYYFNGGAPAWKAAGYPIETGD